MLNKKRIDSNKKLKKFFNEEFEDIRKKKNTRAASKYFGQVGSTQTEDIPYIVQLETKVKAIQNIFDNLIPRKLLTTVSITPSPKEFEYRFRMDFVSSYDPYHEPNTRFGQRKKGQFNWVVDMDESVIFSNKVFKKVRKVYNLLQEKGLRNYDLIKHDGELRYLVVRSHKDQSMLNIVTKTDINEELIKEAVEFALSLGFNSINWVVQPEIGDSSQGKVVKTWGNNSIRVKIANFQFSIGAHSFFQNNIDGFKLILDYVEQIIKKLPEENKHLLYDLYSGTGVIGIYFNNYFDRVAGFELIDENIELAEVNIKENSVNNFKIYKTDLNSKEQLAGIQQIANQILVVDPPRTGLEARGIEHVLNLNPQFIIYISCNPITQANDVFELKVNNYKVISIQIFDLFPQTYHMENVIVLERT